MNFSFCLITRNEAQTLPRLLASLEDYKKAEGEVCVLDTGSTDGTAQIAREWGCVVEEVGTRYQHVITNDEAYAINERFVVMGEKPVVSEGDRYFDFGSARNHSASLASHDVVSFADADEVLVSLDFEAINKLVDEGFDQFEYNFVFAHDPEGRPQIEFVQSKFYNRTKMKWVGIIHEVLQGEGNRHFLTKEQFGLEHYQNEATNRSGYLKGLAVDCFNNPDNDRNSHYFAREMFYTERYRSAIKEFERHIAMNRWAAERAQSLIFIGDCYGRLNEPKNQEEAYMKAFFVSSDKRESLLRLAHYYKFNKNPKACAAMTAAAMEIPWSGFYADSKPDYEDVPHSLMYWAQGWLGNVPRARYHILEALKFQPYHPDYLRDTRYYFEYGAPDIEGWMTFPELTWLYKRAKEMGNIVEIGSWKGRSTHALLSGCKGDVCAIDTWSGSKDPSDKTHGRDVQNDFMINVGGFPNIHMMRTTSIEASSTFPDKSVDMVFIDAGHTYEEVKADIEAWLPKARLLICGHDYSETWPEVMKAVDEAFGKPDGVAGTIWYKWVGPKVSIIIPTMNTRPEGMKLLMDSIKALRYPQELIETVVIDGPGTVPFKVKEGVTKSDGQWIVYAADDMTFDPDCIREALEHADAGYSLIAFHAYDVSPDGGNICEHFMIKRSFLSRLENNEIFSTDFHHVGCDNWLWAQATKMGLAIHCPEAKIDHRHFSKTGKSDVTYDRGWSMVEQDRAILAKKLASL